MLTIFFLTSLEVIWKLRCKYFFLTSAVHVFKMVTIRAECIQGQAGNNMPSLSQNHNFHIFPVPIPTFNPSFLFLNHRADRSVIQLSPLSFNASCPSNLSLTFVVKSSVCFNSSNWSTTMQHFKIYFVYVDKISTIFSPLCFFAFLDSSWFILSNKLKKVLFFISVIGSYR